MVWLSAICWKIESDQSFGSFQNQEPTEKNTTFKIETDKINAENSQKLLSLPAQFRKEILILSKFRST